MEGQIRPFELDLRSGSACAAAEGGEEVAAACTAVEVVVGSSC